MKKKPDLEALKLKAARLLGRIRDLEEKERDEIARPKLRASVGRCFVFDNSYGPGERWPLYAKIVSFNEQTMTFNTIQIQHTSRKELRFNYDVNYCYEGKSYFAGHDWKEIPAKQFDNVAKNALSWVETLVKKGTL